MIKQITQGKSAFFPGSRYLWVALRAPRLLRSCLENPLRILNNNPARHTSEHTQRVKAISCRELRAAHGPHTVVARPNTVVGRRSTDARSISRQSRDPSILTGDRIQTRTHIMYRCAQWNDHRTHAQPLVLHLCLPFVCSPTMSPLTSHPLILDTRAAVAPCPPAKVTAMVDNSAATSDLDGTP